jgi:hypothetical protein
MELSLLDYKSFLKVKNEGDQIKIWDPVRKIFIYLTEEEMVRQLFIAYLHQFLKIPFGVMAVERQIRINRRSLRFDMVIYSPEYVQPMLLIEFKKPDSELNQAVIDQLCVYNSEIMSPYLLASNGRSHLLIGMLERGEYTILEEWPKDLKRWL